MLNLNSLRSQTEPVTSLLKAFLQHNEFKLFKAAQWIRGLTLSDYTSL